MKALQISFDTPGKLRLPAAYQHLVQSLLYSCWEKDFPTLHAPRDAEGARQRKLFCFGRLEGRYWIDGAEIVFVPPVSLELRSAADALVDVLAEELRRNPESRLGDHPVSVCGLVCETRWLFPDSALIQTRSPITVYETLPDGKTRYFSPEDAAWQERLRRNLEAKADALGISSPAVFSLEPVGGPKKQVSRFKGTYITGYSGRFRLRADAGAMAILYHCGLGNRNSQGFGLFDLLDK